MAIPKNVMDVVCPECGARPGQLCVRPVSRSADKRRNHWARIKKFHAEK